MCLDMLGCVISIIKVKCEISWKHVYTANRSIQDITNILQNLHMHCPAYKRQIAFRSEWALVVLRSLTREDVSIQSAIKFTTANRTLWAFRRNNENLKTAPLYTTIHHRSKQIKLISMNDKLLWKPFSNNHVEGSWSSNTLHLDAYKGRVAESFNLFHNLTFNKTIIKYSVYLPSLDIRPTSSIAFAKVKSEWGDRSMTKPRPVNENSHTWI